MSSRPPAAPMRPQSSPCDGLGALVLLPPELYITLFIPRSRWVVVGAGEISRHRWTIHLHQILLNFKTT